MPLPSQPMHIPAGLPIDEATRVELSDVGGSNRANRNVRATQRGALEKRLGFGALSLDRFDDVDRSAGWRLLASDGQICTIDGTYLDSYSPEMSRAVVRSRVPEASFTTRELWAPGRSYSITDTLIVNGYTIVSYLASEGIGGTNYGFVSVSDASSGTLISVTKPSIYESTTLEGVRIAGYGVYAIALVCDSGTNDIFAYYLDTTSATTIANGWVSTGGAVATDFASSMSACSLTTRIAIAYANNSGGASRATVKTITIAGVSQSAAVGTGAFSPASVDVDGRESDTLWVAWNQTTFGHVQGYAPTNLASVTATDFAVITSAGTISKVRVCASTTTGKGALAVDTSESIEAQGFQDGGAAVTLDGDFVTTYGASIAGHPFFYSGRYYMPVTQLVGDAMCVVDWTPDRDALDTIGLLSFLRPVVTPVERGLFVLGAARTGVDGSTFYYAFTRKASSVANAAVLVTMDFADPQRWQSVEHGGSTYLSGGTLAVFDGDRVFESGFLTVPNKPTTSLSGTGITATVGWRYVAVFEHIDARGNWHVSGVSLPSDSTGAVTNKTVDVATYPLAITARADRIASSESQIRVAFYRTLDGAEPPYYRVGTVESYPGLASLIYVDVTSDATLASRHLLYGTGQLPATNGASQDHRAMPGPSVIVSYNGMLVGALGSSLWWSSQTVSGEGLWHNPAFQVPIDDAEDITALAAQDGTLFPFKRRTVYATSGEAPSDNAAVGGLGVVRVLATDVGCVDQRSVVVTSMGIFFLSERGIELLTRSQAVVYVGDKVSSTVAAFPICTSAVLDSKRSVVRFTMTEAEPTGDAEADGVTLVFDLTVQGWISLDDYPSDESPTSAAILTVDGEPRYSWLGPDGEVHYERLDGDADECLDGTTFVPASYTLPPWKVGLQQEQRINGMMMLFERHSAAGLKVEVAHDYGAFGAEADKVWTEGQTSGQRQLPWNPKGRGTAIQLRVTDTAPAVLGTGRGFTFVGISAEIAPTQQGTRSTTRLSQDLRR